MSNSDDNIPTLNEMIFPGKPEKIPAQPQEDNSTQSDYSTTRSDTDTPHPGQNARPQAKQTNFEALINKQIDTILERHIHAAREEIVRVVMLELRSRLPNAGRRNP